MTAFFQAQIAAAKRVQQRVLEQPPDPARPQADLATTIRPALIRIGDRIAMLLVERAAEQHEEPAGPSDARAKRAADQ